MVVLELDQHGKIDWGDYLPTKGRHVPPTLSNSSRGEDITPISFFGLLFSMSNMSSLMRGSFVRSLRFDPCILVGASRGFSQCRAQMIIGFPRCSSESMRANILLYQYKLCRTITQ